jgi:hypothetical protein
MEDMINLLMASPHISLGSLYGPDGAFILLYFVFGLVRQIAGFDP